MTVLTVRLLGPLEVYAGAQPVQLTSGRLRTLVAMLALHAGRRVGTDDLIAAMWGDRLPDHPVRSLQTYAVRLRAACRGVRVESSAAGFALDVAPEDVDAIRFGRLIDEAAGERDRDREYALLSEALRLWRGQPLDGVPSEWLVTNEAPRWVERQLAAWERRVDLALDDGRQDELLADLRGVAARHPLRESLWARLLSALHRSGRTAEALDAYQTLRDVLATDLGVDPGPALRRLHADLVSGRAPDPARHRSSAPHQLPATVHELVGQRTAVETLDALLDDEGRGTTAAVGVLTGIAGVGKTTVAIWWANHVADRFPDGQLYVDLGGFGPAEAARDPADVRRDLLESLGVRPAEIPVGEAAQAGMLRSLLAGRKVLLVLDNARDAEQVRPLLPRSGGCLTIVTSRNDLASLVVTEDALAVPLDVLSPADARRLLALRVGQRRADDEPHAVQTIVDACGQLPLALAIVGARARLRPSVPLQALAEELSTSRATLSVLETGDGATDVRAVFSWSLRAIPPDAGALFRLLGVHPGQEISVNAAASIAGRTPPATKTLLTRLERASLVSQRRAGRYVLHDLVRAYANELATEAEGAAATRRLLDYYTASAYAADRALDPNRYPPALPPPPASPTGEHFADQRHALTWLTDELPGLLAATNHAAEHAVDASVALLCWSLTTFLDRQGLWHDWANTQRHALTVATRTADRPAEALAHLLLARALTRLHEYTQAFRHFTAAVSVYGELHDLAGQAKTYVNLGWLFEEQADFATALPHNKLALELFEQIGDQVGEAKASNAIGWDYSYLGEPEQALANCERALAIHRKLGNHDGQSETLDSLGRIHLQLGDHDAAVDCYRRAIDTCRDTGDRARGAKVQWHLGDAYRDHGETGPARASYAASLRVLDELGLPDANLVRERLDQLGTMSSRPA